MVPVPLSSLLNDAIKTEWNILIDSWTLLVAEWTWNSELQFCWLVTPNDATSTRPKQVQQRGFVMFNVILFD